jgi:hypothetical protein
VDRAKMQKDGLTEMTEEMQTDQDNLTIAVVVTGVFLMIELPNQLRMFDFFTTFVRALYETIFDSAQILTSFAIIIFMQAFLIWVTDQGQNLVGWTGISQSVISSYFMSLGDFAISDTFAFGQPPEEDEDGNLVDINHRFAWLFWIVFFLCTFISMLIILNMVIAVMAASFDRVQGENEAHILKGKVEVILNYWFRIPSSYKRLFKEFKYLVLVDIDPMFDPIKDEDSEDRIRADIKSLKKQVFNIGYYQSKSNFNLQTIHKRFNKLDKKIELMIGPSAARSLNRNVSVDQ